MPTNQPDDTCDDLAALVARLSVDQVRYIVARQEFSKDKDAAEAIGVNPATVKRWKYEGAPIDEAVRMMALDGLVIARELRRRNLAKAMAVKVAGLDYDDDRLRQSVSTEIIEWEMGKAAQKIEQSGERNVNLHIVYDEPRPRPRHTPADAAPETE